MSEERAWLRHSEHLGYFHCPADAVEEFQKLGWEPSGPPEEHNPVTAERTAWIAEQAAAAAKTESKPSKNTKE